MTKEHRKAFREAVRRAQLGDWLRDYRDTWIEKLHDDLNPEPNTPAIKRANDKQ